ncbi:MAG: YitT family protein [Clostridiaceae bacterium]|nr:YitT family protein [Clostridiaceae bacterium]
MDSSGSDFSKQKRISQQIRSGFFLVFGSFLAAFAINIFYTPLMLTTGGVTGIGSIIFQLTGRGEFLPLGVIVAILNLPLLLLGWIKVSWRFVYKSIIGSALYSLALTITEKPMVSWFDKYLNKPTLNGKPDLLIFCLFGGIIFGIAVGLILRSGYTTGGTDIIAVIFHRKFPSISIGKIVFILDIIIVTSSIFFYQDIESDILIITMYSFVAMWLTSKFTDITLEGFEVSRIAYIISDKHHEIAEEIIVKLDRGATGLQAKGMYSKKNRGMIFCVMPSRQVPELKQIVEAIDPNAFIIVTEAREVLGEGFEKDSHDFL